MVHQYERSCPLALIDEALSRHAGLLIRAIEMTYGRGQHFALVRRSILATFGQQGLQTEIRHILSGAVTKVEIENNVINETR